MSEETSCEPESEIDKNTSTDEPSYKNDSEQD